VDALIVALPETAGSALYGMVDVLAATGTLWHELAGEEPPGQMIRPRIVGLSRESFRCGNGIPIVPELGVADDPQGALVILPEMWLATDDDMRGRYPELLDWTRRRHGTGSTIYSACSGTVLLAATGLLDGREATSHWGYRDLFRTRFPKVAFRPEPNLVFADPGGRIVTAGGATSWHDLAIHIVSRHCSPGEALRIAKAYLLKWHGEGQLPYATLVRRLPHADSAVRAAEDWLRRPERSLKRRFKAATGSPLIGYVQNLRIEEAKRLLESSRSGVDEISFDVGYENLAFFRRLFKRSTGLSPADYRRMFRPLAAAEPAPAGRRTAASGSRR
jgi:transcriptional regulator GlxA family with amidase domain